MRESFLRSEEFKTLQGKEISCDALQELKEAIDKHQGENKNSEEEALALITYLSKYKYATCYEDLDDAPRYGSMSQFSNKIFSEEATDKLGKELMIEKQQEMKKRFWQPSKEFFNLAIHYLEEDKPVPENGKRIAHYYKKLNQTLELELGEFINKFEEFIPFLDKKELDMTTYYLEGMRNSDGSFNNEFQKYVALLNSQNKQFSALLDLFLPEAHRIRKGIIKERFEYNGCSKIDFFRTLKKISMEIPTPDVTKFQIEEITENSIKKIIKKYEENPRYQSFLNCITGCFLFDSGFYVSADDFLKEVPERDLFYLSALDIRIECYVLQRKIDEAKKIAKIIISKNGGFYDKEECIKRAQIYIARFEPTSEASQIEEGVEEKNNYTTEKTDQNNPFSLFNGKSAREEEKEVEHEYGGDQPLLEKSDDGIGPLSIWNRVSNDEVRQTEYSHSL